MRNSMEVVVLMPKLSVALKQRVKVGNCLEGRKSGQIGMGCRRVI